MSFFLSSPQKTQIHELFQEVVDLPEAERAAVLRRACGGDVSLRRQVEVLIAVDERGEALLSQMEPASSDVRGNSRWDKLEMIFDLALLQSPEERADFLDEICGSDAGLRAELESLLRYDEASDYFDRLAEAVIPSIIRHRPTATAMEPNSLDRLIGHQISHYEVMERLGGGGMGIVYKALDVLLGRLVALKFLPPHLNADVQAERRFIQEAQAASALDHPNVGTIHEIGQAEDGRWFIAMTYYRGETLKKKMDGSLPVSVALGYVVQIAEGLAAAHAAGIVHRDIKPANVMVTESGVAKIVDFGLAKVHDVHITRTGSRLGTLVYMSPEQTKGGEVDHRTDIWALGAVLYEMLAGERPFDGEHEAAILYEILHVNPPPLTAVRTDVPPGLAQIVQRCLKKDPAERYQDLDALLADLQRVQQDQTIELPDTRPPSIWEASQTALRVVTQRKTPLVLAVGVLTLLAVFGWYYASRVPTTRHLAVLPFRVIGEAADAEAFSDGLFETLTSKLTQLEQFQGSLWVVPASEIDGPITPSEARDRFGATMVVSGSVQFVDDRVRLTLNLIDTGTRRQLDAKQIDDRSGSALALQDEAILALVRMLQVRLNREERQVLVAGGPTALQANTFYLRGLGYLRNHQSLAELDTAIVLFDRALVEDPGFALAYAGLGEAYWEKYGRTDDVLWVDDALENSRLALQLDDRLAPVYVTLGIIHSGQGSHDAALEAFAQALAIDPFNAEAYRGRALTYRRQGASDEAEASYRQAIALKPDYWRGYNSLGVFYYLNGRYEEAIAQYEHGLSLAPANQKMLLNTGAAYWDLERLDEAIRIFERILQLNPDHAAAKSNLATAYFYRGRFVEAGQLYEEELALQPNDYLVQGYLGDTYYWIPGERDRSDAAYRRATAMVRTHLAVRPQDPALLGQLANYYAKRGLPDSARIYLAQMEALQEPEQADVRVVFGNGEIYETLGDRSRALAWMRSALERDYGWIQLQYSPWLEALRRDPEIQRLLADHRKNTP